MTMDRDARALELQLPLHHLRSTSEAAKGLRLMTERAQDNMRRYKAKLPLIGHLLPYLTAEEATQAGLPFREDHGWVEEQEIED